MRISTITLGALLLAATATPAFAQEAEGETAPPDAITITGSVAVTSDYRFRGVSQSDKEAAVQGGITISHESGFYVGTWGSNLSGWGTFGGANLELDLIAGYKRSFGGATVDVGLLWYVYPGGFDNSDVAEPYIKVSGTAGPVTLTAGVAYAPKQESLGNFSNTPFSRGQSEDNIYLSGDAVGAVPGTPFTLKGHIGYSDGNPGLGPNGTSLAPTGEYWDWALGIDTTYKNLTLGVSYVDTDLDRAEVAYIQPNFSKTTTGDEIADPTVVFTLTAAF